MRLVQEALGHEDLTATRIDIHILNGELDEAGKVKEGEGVSMLRVNITGNNFPIN